MGDWTDLPFKLRYGVTGDEKYRQAMTGAIPGAQPIGSEEDAAREERRASGYLFAKEHPAMAPIVQPIVDNLRAKAFGDSPAVIAAAQQGQNAAVGPVDEATKASTGKVRTALKIAGVLTMGGLPHAALASWDTAALHLFGKR